jgi:Fic family protein
MLSSIILFKYGYDIKRLLNIEKQIVINRGYFLQVIKITKAHENVTEWIEFFSSLILDAYKNIEIVLSKHNSTKTNKLFQLTPRQKNILSLLDNPNVRITNKLIQESFHISQLTASRELSTLSNRGLLLSIGKGRSTYYTKL